MQHNWWINEGDFFYFVPAMINLKAATHRRLQYREKPVF